MMLDDHGGSLSYTAWVPCPFLIELSAIANDDAPPRDYKQYEPRLHHYQTAEEIGFG